MMLLTAALAALALVTLTGLLSLYNAPATADLPPASEDSPHWLGVLAHREGRSGTDWPASMSDADIDAWQDGWRFSLEGSLHR